MSAFSRISDGVVQRERERHITQVVATQSVYVELCSIMHPCVSCILQSFFGWLGAGLHIGDERQTVLLRCQLPRSVEVRTFERKLGHDFA